MFPQKMDKTKFQGYHNLAKSKNSPFSAINTDPYVQFISGVFRNMHIELKNGKGTLITCLKIVLFIGMT